MTIWLLAFLVVGSGAGMGLRQGIIRVGFSFVGILFALLLAWPIGHLLAPLLGHLPMWAWELGPAIVFVLVMVGFKIAGSNASRRINAHFKHKESDLQLALWERMSHRVGMCLGIVNGTLYLMLISYAIYTPAYWTFQLGQSPAAENATMMKVFNRLGADLQRTGMNKVAGAVRTTPPSYYEAGDIVGLIYNNPPLTDRLSHHPDLISLAEKPELKDIANDADLGKMRRDGAPISDLLAHPAVKKLLSDRAFVSSLWNQLTPDLPDIKAFLETGKSPKYGSEKLLGKWNFSPQAATAAFRKTKPTVTLVEMRTFRQWMSLFSKTTLAAGAPPDNSVIIDGIPTAKPGETIALHGKWSPDGTDVYKLTMTSDVGTQEFTATVDGNRLIVSFAGYALGFTKAE